MKILFTKNNKPLSKLITWGLNEPVSHLAIVFDNKLVFHSNYKGLHVEWYETFKKQNTIVYELEYSLNFVQEEIVYQDIINQYDGSGYDYAALLYFMYRGILNKLFKIPFPEKNKWNNNKFYLCVETLMLFKQIDIDGDLSMMSPYKVYLALKETGSGR